MYKDMYNKFSISKTLRFELKPIGKTLENIKQNEIIEEGVKKYASYLRLKPLIDDFYKDYIDKALSVFSFSVKARESIDEIFNDDIDDKKLESIKKEITSHFSNYDKDYNVFKKELIDNKEKGLMYKFLKENNLYEEYKKDLDEYKGFSTFLTSGFLQNRSFIFQDTKEGSISYRIINDNLKIFISNLKIYLKNKEVIDSFISYNNLDIYNSFDLNYYNYFITEKGIEKYNSVIAGIGLENKKIKGLNEYINEYNQVNEKSNRIPFFKQLKKQILADREKLSFVYDKYEEDKDLYNAFAQYKEELFNSLDNLNSLILKIENYDLDNIYIKKNKVTSISNLLYEDFSYIDSLIKNDYDDNYNGKVKKQTKKYDEEKENYFKEIEGYKITYLLGLIKDNKVLDYIKEILNIDFINRVKNEYQEILNLINDSLREEKKLIEDKKLKEKIRLFLEEIIEVRKNINILNTNIPDKDLVFYNVFEEYIDVLNITDTIFNQTRNYLTKKPFSTEKLRLYFGKGTLFNGWSESKGALQYYSAIFLDDNNYYVAILNNSNTLNKVVEVEKGDIRMLSYYQIANAYMSLPKNYITSELAQNNKNLTQEIKEIYESGSFKKNNDNFDINDLHILIDFFKKCIKENPKISNMIFRETNKYEDINEFYKEVDQQSYVIGFKNYNRSDIESLIDNKEIYLFQVYNKDFSKYSYGNKNLHTMYFQELFSKENIKNPVFKLLGNAQLFYRKASHEYKVTHPKNVEINNKNPLNPKKTSVFNYDLIKYKRYTEDKFLFHVPIKINFNSDNELNINESIINCIKNYDDVNIIGIDRGERNLLYLSLIDKNGNILEQGTLDDTSGFSNISFDYHKALMKKEKELMDARKTWGDMGTIKELKEGYMSYVVHRIAKMVEKYNAIVVLESLNSGFKNSRKKVERSVYQKFEKSLIDKFNYLVFKNKDINELGGLRKAYQLTYPVNTYNDIYFQVGNIFYVDPYLTSKIDPTTGYAKLIFPNNCKTINEMKSFIEKIKDIRFNEKEDYFEFDIDYKEYAKTPDCSKTLWTICTNSSKLIDQRNAKGIFENKEVNPTCNLKELLKENNIDYNNIKEGLLNLNNRKDLSKFLYNLDVAMSLRSSNADSIDGEIIDKIISPVKNKYNEFYDSDNNKNNTLPKSADANGAYNIALKGLMIVNRIKESKDLKYQKGIKKNDYLNFIIERNK